MTTHTSELRAHVLELLHGGHAHVSFEDAVADLPQSLRGKRPDSLPYSPWELVEHIRISARDILDYTLALKAADYKAMAWPKDYWPKSPTPPSATAWDDSIAAIGADRDSMERLVKDNDLFAVLPISSDGHTLLRQALLLADHNAYHVGELIAVRRLLGAWH
jgi:hypothetical protein